MGTESTPQARSSVAALDSMLGMSLKVLDDGFVRVVDYMGSDASVVQAARISYGAGTKHINEDRGLIRYLMRHRHTTPFEMCEIKLHVRVPMDCWRQWIRHRTANVNEYSTRYSEAINTMQSTQPDRWRLQSTVNKQGSGSTAPSDVGVHLSNRELAFQGLAREVYEERLTAGVAREQARKDLPLSTYTEAYWKIDLHNLLHFLSLRMDSHAQDEIRSYANAIGNQIVSKWCPIVWEAFIDYRMDGLSLTRIDLEVIKGLLAGNRADAITAAKSAGLLQESEKGLIRSREREELEGKLLMLGLPVPWPYDHAK